MGRADDAGEEIVEVEFAGMDATPSELIQNC
jgi:hypothetical protein